MLNTFYFLTFIVGLITVYFLITPKEQPQEAAPCDGVILYGIIGKNPFEFLENKTATLDEWRKILSTIDPSMRGVFKICTASYLLKYCKENYYLELGRLGYDKN